MTDDPLPAFYHRKSNAESFDSICGKCFQTVAIRKTEEELKALRTFMFASRIALKPSSDPSNDDDQQRDGM
jgi:hypothetical protein